METRNGMIKALVDGVQAALPTKKVHHKEVTKNNGVKLDGLCVSLEDIEDENTICTYATFYINTTLDQMVIDDLSVEEAVNEIVTAFKEFKKAGNIPFKSTEDLHSIVSDKEEFLKRVRKCLVSKDRNEDIQRYPHKNFCDLMIMYRVFLGNGASFLVNQGNMELCGATEKEIEIAAERNAEYIHIPLIEHLKEINPSYNEYDSTNDFMKILTNKERSYGASAMTDKKLLKEIGDSYGCDYIIIPSSINEVMTFPTNYCNVDDLPYFKQMVRDVNRNTIADTDFLSDSIYIYRRNAGMIEIAA